MITRHLDGLGCDKIARTMSQFTPLSKRIKADPQSFNQSISLSDFELHFELHDLELTIIRTSEGLPTQPLMGPDEEYPESVCAAARFQS